MSYRPITDVWILARPKVKFYGAYPSGFLHRARQLLGVGHDGAVLHVCSGMVRSYPFRGLGAGDRTVDVDPGVEPDYVVDVTSESLPRRDGCGYWDAALCDPPYTSVDASKYGAATLPGAGKLLRDCLDVVRPGGRVGILHYELPRPPRSARFVAAVGVLVGYGNRIRCYSVFERGDGA